MHDIVVSDSNTRAPRVHSVVDEGGWITTVARVTLPNGATMLQADISTIELRIFNRSKARRPEEQVCPTASPLTADVVFDTLQTDGWWDTDLAGSLGYNFRHTVTVGTAPWLSAVLQGGEKYQLEYKLNTALYGPLYLIHIVDVAEVMSQ